MVNLHPQLKLIQQTASDLLPFGKVPPVGGPDPDTDDEGKFLNENNNQIPFKFN